MAYSQTIVQFDPQSDITTYELALCTKYLINATYNRGLVDKAYFDGLPSAVKRHFVATEVDPVGGGGGEE